MELAWDRNWYRNESPILKGANQLWLSLLQERKMERVLYTCRGWDTRRNAGNRVWVNSVNQ